MQWFRHLGISQRLLRATSFCQWSSADAICVVSNAAKLEVLAEVDDDPLAHHLYRRLVRDRFPDDIDQNCPTVLRQFGSLSSNVRSEIMPLVHH